MTAFPFKDDTNTGGAPLCVNCFHAEGICRGEFYCALDQEFHFNVGVCNKFKEYKNNGK